MCEAKHLVAAICLLAVVAGCQGSEVDTQDEKSGKVIPLFNVVKFLNDVCTATNARNGSCYTTQECSDKGGTAAGTCADGFGVCCTFVLGCGGKTSANNSYLVQASATTLTDMQCVYKVCPVASSVCRIRYDFTTLVLDNPPSQIGSLAAAAAPAGTAIAQVGNCITSGMSITGSGASTPVICGTNSGEHVIVDSDGLNCQMANFFNDGSNAGIAKFWDIWVTQYQCGELDVSRAGPKGCLQYFTGSTNTVKSFSFRGGTDPTTTATNGQETHLNNQDYTVCIRREFGRTRICWSPIGNAGATAATQGNYGLSVSPTGTTTALASQNTHCSQDYITIPGASTITANRIATLATSLLDRFCGRAFNTDITGTAHATICSITTPFRLGVHFDGSELSDGTTAMAQLAEFSLFPTGNLGFALHYSQT